MTPRMLLSHTSGFRNFAPIELDKKMHLHFKPGTQFLYSGDGINLVQFVIEQKKQQPLDQLMQDALFTPLGMTRTGLIYRTEFAADVADRYDLDEKFRSQTKRFPARGRGFDDDECRGSCTIHDSIAQRHHPETGNASGDVETSVSYSNRA